MTREQVANLLKHRKLLKHFADGGEIQFCFHRYDGKFLEWSDADRVLIACIGSYRIKKPHYVVRGGKLKASQRCDCELRPTAILTEREKP